MESPAILGLGAYLPALKHTNETLPPLDQPLDRATLARIGVHTRHWAADGESVVDMAEIAGRRALADARIEAAQLDLLILADWSQRRHVPDLAPQVASRLGATAAFSFDIGCACAGFIVGLATARAFLRSTPGVTTGLIVAAETTSRRGRPGSKATLIFGDAAAAFVLASNANADSPGRLIDLQLHSDGAQHGIMDTSAEGWIRTHVPQRDLVQLAGSSLAEVSRKLLSRNNIDIDAVDWIIPHSGTAGVQAMMRETLKVPDHKVLTNFPYVGNVTSASIPLAVSHFRSTGVVRAGDLILSPVVGAGWYAAAALYTVAGTP